MEPVLLCKRLHPDAKLPARQTEQAACYDLSSLDTVIVPPSTLADNGNVDVGFAIVSTGIILAIPDGYMGRVCARSGFSFRHNIEVGAGIIDADYRGEIRVKLLNLSDHHFRISAGDRIAQIAIVPIARPDVIETATLPDTARGENGFGSTGISS